MLAGFSRDELLHELLVAPREAILALPDSVIIQRAAWWQIVTPSLTRGGLNEVICNRPLDDAEVDEALRPYRERELRFRFTVHPDALDAALPERLARHGLRRSEALGMACLTQDAPAPASGVAIEPVDASNVDDFTQVMAAGWQVDPAPMHTLHLRMLADPAQRQHLFIARWDGAAAAVGSHVSLARSAYLIGAVTLPEHRGRGLYRELVNARLRHAAASGRRVATTLARAETSAPILARLGFTTLAVIPVFTNL